MEPVLETRGLRFEYGRGTPFAHMALDGVDLRIYEGEFIGLIGHTGSGKSTLIQHFNGLLSPTGGQIFFKGQDIHADKFDLRGLRFQVGLVFQYPEYQLFEETVYADIAFGPKNIGLSEDEIRSRVLEAAAFVGLPESILNESPFDLSGGQKRRVAIAGVLAMRPQVLILDEPTAGLDPGGSRQILEEIRAYREQTGSTVILVSHNMEDIASIATRLIVLNEAKIAFDGTPEEVFSHPDELVAMGLDVPQVTRVFMKLRELGIELDTSVYTVGYAVKLVQKLLAKEAPHA
ncbi:MAG: energy-coupling factor transporter ATPase [Clostridia bacterium]|nr:energy-coupling factor transporter ATPase [Oscillospiraceae bacterium]MBR6747347.1 energy-coupling factor transporter ATPase [Clostridia bacterium]